MSGNYPNLLSSFQNGNLKLRNRSVLPGLTSNFSGENGEVTDQLIQFLKSRADGGVGLIFVESVFVDWSGKGTPRELGIHEDHLVPGLQRLTDAIHDSGAKVMPQLTHCGRQMTSAFSKVPTIAPSAIADPVVGEMPKEMSKEEIKHMIGQFARAAKRAQDANFDGVEIMAGHGYLISQFLTPYANKRQDEYGGSFENRIRFLREIIEETRKLVDPDFPIVCRINAEEYVEDGIHLSEAIEVAKALESFGVDIIDVSVSVKESYHYLSVTSGEPMANQSDMASEIKKNVSIPVITAGRIITPELAESVLEQKKADLVAIGRGFIADPDFIKKAENQQAAEIIPCIGCNACNARSHRPQIICTVNSSVGRELHLRENVLAQGVLEIGIIGSSIAGLEAAKVASGHGHSVTILEPTGELGGLFGAVRKRVPGQEELGKAQGYYERIIKERNNIKVVFQADTSKEAVESKKFDIIYVALAGKIAPRFSGLNAPYAIDVLKDELLNEDQYTIVGNGILAAETALYLAINDKKVSFVYEGKYMITDAHPTIRFYTQKRLEKYGVKTIQEERLTSETIEVYKNIIQTHEFNEETVKEKYTDCAEKVIYLGDAYEASQLAERVWDAGEVPQLELERKI